MGAMYSTMVVEGKEKLQAHNLSFKTLQWSSIENDSTRHAYASSCCREQADQSEETWRHQHTAAWLRESLVEPR
jgi:hypothetical protein